VFDCGRKAKLNIAAFGITSFFCLGLENYAHLNLCSGVWFYGVKLFHAFSFF
jgi:hypothetical protein